VHGYPQNLFDGYLEIPTEQAKCSVRTIQRLIAQRLLPVTYFGKRPLVHLESARKALAARTIQPTTGRGRK
jgi:hypothetical protein